MRLRIDGRETALDLSGIVSFSGLMEALYKKVGAEGRIPSRLVVDGKEMSARAEEETAQVDLASVSDISVETCTLKELLRSSLDGAVALSEAIGIDIGRAVAAFRQGDAPTGQSYYIAFIEAMGTFFQFVNALLSGIQAGHLRLPAGEDGSPVLPAPPSDATAEILQRLLEFQKGDDWTAMADVLEYEMVPNLKSWGAFFGGLRDAQEK